MYINARENRWGNQEWTNPEKTEWPIKNGQSRDTDNICHTMHRTKTNNTQKI